MNKSFMLPPRRRFTCREKRRNAELEWARSNLVYSNGSNDEAEKGLQLVHELKEHDAEMRWLAELFPLEEGIVFGGVAERRLGEWCAAHPDDARALAHLAVVRHDTAMLEKAAAMGDVLALAVEWHSKATGSGQFLAASALAEAGSAEGTYHLAVCVRCGRGCSQDERAASELFERAAELGSYRACRELIDRDTNPAKELKYLIPFCSVRPFDLYRVVLALDEVLRSHAEEGSFGSAIFDAGEQLKECIDVKAGTVFGEEQVSGHLKILSRAVAMYDRWCGVAREACVAWVLVAKRMGVNKDVRKIIAKSVWESRREIAGGCC